ncbi:MAG: hypothetical protein EOQ47_28425 [Mesorhizobium sp.]|nr:MAG: hypothetical protein EOQ47_28425 [Mesorhizobium sp.]
MARKRRHIRKGASAYSDLLLAPAVIAMRLPIIALEASSAAPKGEEAILAVTEKTLACAEGMAAAQGTIFSSALRFWPEVFSGRSPSLVNGDAVKEVILAALKPVSRRVRINFDRLSKSD